MELKRTEMGFEVVRKRLDKKKKKGVCAFLFATCFFFNLNVHLWIGGNQYLINSGSLPSCPRLGRIAGWQKHCW